MKVLFIICPSLGIGEAYTADRLSEQLVNVGWKVYFLGTEIVTLFEGVKNENTWVLSEDNKENYNLLNEIVSSVSPDLFIFTDYNMYIKNSFINFSFEFNWLDEFNIPCMVIDTVGNCQNEVLSSLYENEGLILPKWVDAVLRPVPPHDPVDSENKRLIHFSVFTEFEEQNVETKQKIKQDFKVEQDKKLVVLPLGHWINLVAGTVEHRLYKYMLRIFVNYLCDLEYDIELVILGDKSCGSSNYKNVYVRTDLAEISFSKAEELISISDLMITTNRFSSSLGRAARYKVPTISFINSTDIVVSQGRIMTDLNFEISPYINRILQLVTGRNGKVKKFAMFPEYDTGIINEFYSKNPRFAEIVPTCEIFDKDTTVTVLKSLLSEDRHKLTEKQSNFMNKAYKHYSADKKIMEFTKWNIR